MKIQTSESHNLVQSNLTKFSKTRTVKKINDRLDTECIYAVVNKPQKSIKDQEVNKILPS